MSDEPPTDRWFPINRPEHSGDSNGDTIARVIATVAVLLVAAFYLAHAHQEVDRVNRDRAACVRQRADLKIELDAWRSVYEALALKSVDSQIKRVESVIRRDCDKRYPEPSIP